MIFLWKFFEIIAQNFMQRQKSGKTLEDMGEAKSLGLNNGDLKDPPRDTTF